MNSNQRRKNEEMVFFRHPFSLEYWRCAAAQLKNPKMIIIAAILVALRVALKSIVIPVGENLNIYITFFVNALGGMIFGLSLIHI